MVSVFGRTVDNLGQTFAASAASTQRGNLDSGVFECLQHGLVLSDLHAPPGFCQLRALPKITESIVPQIQKLCWVGFTRMRHALALRDDSSGPSARCTQAFSGDDACSERTEPPALCRDGSACAGTWRGQLDVADQRAGTLDDLSWTCRHSRPCFCSVGT